MNKFLQSRFAENDSKYAIGLATLHLAVAIGWISLTVDQLSAINIFYSALIYGTPNARPAT